jgi:carbon storage regulator
MLVLTRRTGGGLLIGGNISVKVVSVNRNRVRIGVEAPLSVSVSRSEILTRCSQPAPPPAQQKNGDNNCRP